jgi:hypothetical protein
MSENTEGGEIPTLTQVLPYSTGLVSSVLALKKT